MLVLFPPIFVAIAQIYFRWSPYRVLTRKRCHTFKFMEFLFPIELNNVFQRVENVSLSFGTFLQHKFFLEETVKTIFYRWNDRSPKKGNGVDFLLVRQTQM